MLAGARWLSKSHKEHRWSRGNVTLPLGNQLAPSCTFTEQASGTVPISSRVFIAVSSGACPQHCHPRSPTSLFRRDLTDGSSLALSHRFHDANDTAGLQGRLEPVGGVLHVGHVNAQAAVLTQQDHRGPLLLVAGRVPNGNHVLDLAEGTKEGVSSPSYRSEPTENR